MHHFYLKSIFHPSYTRFLYLNPIVSVEIEPKIPSLGIPLHRTVS